MNNLTIEDFNLMISLLNKADLTIPFVSDVLIDYSKTNRIAFYTTNNEGEGNSISSLLNVYKRRYNIQLNEKNRTVFGFKYLLSKLNEHRYEFVCISNICFDSCTYILFSNFEKSDLLGIIKSIRTIDDIDNTEDWLIMNGGGNISG
jgi:hypothetical protein